MRRAWLVLGAGLLTGLVWQPAIGMPGRDPAPRQGTFQLFVAGRGDDGAEFPINLMSFDRLDGWDFGDRAAYSCAWAEFYEVPAIPGVTGPRGAELFEIHFQRVRGVDWIKINDKFGLERQGGNESRCGRGSRHDPRFDGSDHFPHGTAMSFTLRGDRLVTLDLHDDGCASGYWTPGDEPGEAWLWWDDDGPTNDGHHDLDCGGGPGDPVPVVRAWVRRLAPGIKVCSEDMLDGDRCAHEGRHDRLGARPSALDAAWHAPLP